MSEKKSKKTSKHEKQAKIDIPSTPEEKTSEKQQRALTRMNPNQKEAIIVFMEMHSELLGASVSKLYPREVVDRLWSELTQQLNELGHVPKATSTWKKTWFDMKREVKAKHGPPPYPTHLMSPPDDQSTVGQRGRIAALMTQAVRICQQHAATSLDSLGTLHNPVALDEESRGESLDETAPRSTSPPVEISVKCEPPEFSLFDLDQPPPSILTEANTATLQMNDGETLNDGVPPSAKRARMGPQAGSSVDATFATSLHVLASSQDRIALAMEGMAEAARGLSEVFRRRTAVEIEKVEALKQIACAIRSRPY